MKTLLLALLLLLPFASQAGILTSDFRGKMVDAEGHAVVGAIMVVENLQTGRITRHVSGNTGRWHALNVRSDSTYRVSCYAPGAAIPSVRFKGRVSLGQAHVRNCVIGTLTEQSPSWLSSWSWRQATGDRYVMN